MVGCAPRTLLLPILRERTGSCRDASIAALHHATVGGVLIQGLLLLVPRQTTPPPRRDQTSLRARGWPSAGWRAAASAGVRPWRPRN